MEIDWGRGWGGGGEVERWGGGGGRGLRGKATLTSGLLLGRSEVLRSLRHYMRAQSQGHHTIDRLEERGVER